MACARKRKWPDLVRPHRAVPCSSLGSVIRWLLTLGGLVAIGWLFGGAAPAHADTDRMPGSAVRSPTAPAAIVEGVRGAGDAVRPVLSPVDQRAVRRAGGASTGTAATPPARAGRFTTADTTDPVLPAMRAPRTASLGAASLREPVRDLVRAADATRPVLPVLDSKILAPGGTLGAFDTVGTLEDLTGVVVTAGRSPGSMTEGPAKGDASQASGPDRTPVAAQGERAEPDGRGAPASRTTESIDDGGPAFRAVTTHPDPAHGPVEGGDRPASGTAPMVNGPALSGIGLAYLPGGGLWPEAPSFIAPPAGTVARPVHAAPGEPSFSPD